MATAAITIQDIMDAIDSEPEMLEALRARLLTRELLELPERFAEFQSVMLEFKADMLQFQSNMLEFQANTLEFQKSMTEFKDSMLEFKDSMLEFKSDMLEFQKSTTEFQKSTTEFQSDMLEFKANTLQVQANTLEFQKSMTEFKSNTLQVQANTLEFQKSMTEFRKSTLEFQASAEERFVELGTNVGRLNGWMTSEVGLKEVPLIARGMGYRYRRLLERVELFDMADDADTSGIARGDLESFIRADAVAAATDGEGRAWYVAVELSFTAQKRDVDRAVRNAEFVTRFTGVPASAAVAGIQMADEIRGDVDAGNVFWHELPAKIFQPE